MHVVCVCVNVVGALELINHYCLFSYLSNVAMHLNLSWTSFSLIVTNKKKIPLQVKEESAKQQATLVCEA